NFKSHVSNNHLQYLELQSRGTFLREDILSALTAHQGNLDAAYVELSKAQLKPFLMRIWGPPSGHDNESLPPPSDSRKSSIVDFPVNKPEEMKVKEIILAESPKPEKTLTSPPVLTS